MEGKTPEYHHGDFHYVKDSARVAPSSLYSPTAVRETFIRSHNTDVTFGFATVICVLAENGKMLVWWSKIDTLAFRDLLEALNRNAEHAENELAQCGWKI